MPRGDTLNRAYFGTESTSIPWTNTSDQTFFGTDYSLLLWASTFRQAISGIDNTSRPWSSTSEEVYSGPDNNPDQNYFGTDNASLPWINASGQGYFGMNSNSDRTNKWTMYLAFSAALLITIAGCIGNCLSVTIWSTKEFRKMSRSIICVSLAVANSVALVIGFGQFTFISLYEEDFLAQSKLSCLVGNMLGGITVQLDSYLILYFSVERVIGLFKPNAVKTMFNRKKTIAYVLVITIVCAALNITVTLFDVSVVKMEGGIEVCHVKLTILNVLLYLLTSIIPLIIVIPCNIVIVFKLITQYRKMRNVVAVTQQQLQKKRSMRASTLTLSVTLSYLALILPFNVYVWCCVEHSLEIPLWMWYFPLLNYSVNFYVYTLASEEYRRRVILAWNDASNYMSQVCPSPCRRNAVEPIELNLNE